jgi:hypothetical protein
MRRKWIGYLLLFLLAFGLRLTYILGFQVYENRFKAEMERAATCLVQEGFLGNVYGSDSGPSAHVAPVYATLLAGVYWLLGPDTMAGRLGQEILGILGTSAGIALLPLVAQKARLNSWAGWSAGILMALCPLNLWNETSGGWEQSYSTIALSGLLLGFIALHNSAWENHRLVLGLGILLGLAGLLSPSILPGGVLMVLAELVSRQNLKWRVVRGSLLLFLTFLVCIFPWGIRNYRVMGGFVLFRSNFGLEMAIGNNAYANGKTFDTAWDDPFNLLAQMHPFSNRTERSRLLEIGELAYMGEKWQAARQWIVDHPGEFASLTCRRFALFWFPPENMWSPSVSSRWVRSLGFCLVGAGAWLGLSLLGWLRHPYAGLWLALMFGASFVYLISHVDPRYRYPLFGFSVLLSCEAVYQIVGFFRFAPAIRGVDRVFGSFPIKSAS